MGKTLCNFIVGVVDLRSHCHSCDFGINYDYHFHHISEYHPVNKPHGLHRNITDIAYSQAILADLDKEGITPEYT